MRFVSVMLALAALMSLAGPLGAQINKSSASIALQNATQARECFILGDTAYKKGDLQLAIVCWIKALQIKPNSQYTKQ